MSRKTLASALIMLFIVSIVPVYADEGVGVNLTVTVVAPEYETYVGHGFLYIEDQRAYGKAYLFIPQDTEYPIRLDIIKGKKVVASWEWDIIRHETNIIKRRRYDIIIDTYKCKDGEKRRLLVEIISYRGSTHKTPRASAIGRGAFFLGKNTSP